MAKSNKFLADKRGDMNMVNAGIFLVVLLVVLYVGINIISNVQEASSLSSEDELYDSQQNLINTTESSNRTSSTPLNQATAWLASCQS